MEMTTYDVLVHREVYPEGKWWVFDIPALGATGQVTRLADVDWEARCIIAAWDEDDTDPDEVTVKVCMDGAIEARAIWEAAERDERAAREALSRSAERKREAVSLLRQRRYSASDSAKILGVTRQRIYQLTAK